MVNFTEQILKEYKNSDVIELDTPPEVLDQPEISKPKLSFTDSLLQKYPKTLATDITSPEEVGTQIPVDTAPLN